ncbi:DUF1501 domain-containing protein [Roseisalinus antarcticus]|uniref:Sulfatase n=1 Tax=Roseisalinus antarcticus TaxID=254357 RepID=A0A1Y5TTP9_9RHOB|nr:DUF1501 domain-containing protein [Roseisalinus antarcticus]SLN72374.1 hypothetical protein ROA7023_03595 [Roseisalinus antarcticus]
MDRRMFLSRGLALGCSIAASPLITPMAFASAPWDNRLVVILLRGAMDGLDVIRPVGDPAFADLRPGLTAEAPHHALDGFFAMHDGLSALLPLWQAGEMSFVHAVSTPYRDRRSHFDGQDLLEAGIAGLDEGLRDGWLNRMLATVPGLESEIAFAVGRERMLILSGDAPVSSWAPNTRLELSPATERLLEYVQHSDPLFRDASADAIAIAAEVAAGGEMMGERVGRGNSVTMAQFAASRLVGDTRIASFSISGWDTHNRQHRGLPGRLGELSDTILTLKANLGDVWDKTTVVCMTEFGRTARQNGSDGTDHGTGGAMLLAGGAVRGGRVISDWPGLEEGDLYDRRDLMPTRDVRAHAGWLMRGLFGLSTGTIEGAVFPGMEMGTDPGLLL